MHEATSELRLGLVKNVQCFQSRHIIFSHEQMPEATLDPCPEENQIYNGTTTRTLHETERVIMVQLYASTNRKHAWMDTF